MTLKISQDEEFAVDMHSCQGGGGCSGDKHTIHLLTNCLLGQYLFFTKVVYAFRDNSVYAKPDKRCFC